MYAVAETIYCTEQDYESFFGQENNNRNFYSARVQKECQLNKYLNDNETMVETKTEQYMNESTKSNNQGYEEYLHGSRHLCGYVIAVLNGILNKLLISKSTAVVDPSNFLLLVIFYASFTTGGWCISYLPSKRIHR